MAGLTDAPAASGVPDVAAIENALARLCDAIAAGLPRSRCLRRWSEFIRLRDGQRCVDCHSHEHLAAHHILRKSFLAKAQYETGNGITLCRECHRQAHHGFNGRADMRIPMDAQGGEKLPLMERFYSILLDDSIERGLGRPDFYFLGDEILGFFKAIQGYEPCTEFPGSPLEQAYLILAETERNLRDAIAKANGFTIDPEPLLPGGIVFFSDDGCRPSAPTVVRRYRSRSL